MEVAGFVISVVGVASFFKTCIDIFDIVDKAREFGEEFELICVLLDQQKLRLIAWAEKVGLDPSSSPQGRPIKHYKRALNRPEILAVFGRSLEALHHQLAQADAVRSEYTLREDGRPTTTTTTTTTGGLGANLRGASLVTRFGDRAWMNQRQASAAGLVAWAVHYQGRLRRHVEDITALLDGLCSVTDGFLQQRQRGNGVVLRKIASMCFRDRKQPVVVAAVVSSSVVEVTEVVEEAAAVTPLDKAPLRIQFLSLRPPVDQNCKHF